MIQLSKYIRKRPEDIKNVVHLSIFKVLEILKDTRATVHEVIETLKTMPFITYLPLKLSPPEFMASPDFLLSPSDYWQHSL